MAFNIINFNNLKSMWDKLKNIYIKIGQKVIFQELFNYPKINKPKRYNKSVM